MSDNLTMQKTRDQFDPPGAAATSIALRAELEAITGRYAPTEVLRQVANVAALRSQFIYSVEVVLAVEQAVAGYGQFNCYMYALNIHQSERIVALLERTTQPLGNEFMRWLVKTRRLKPTTSDRQNEDLILYSHSTGPKHAGRWDGSAVVSKW